MGAGKLRLSLTLHDSRATDGDSMNDFVTVHWLAWKDSDGQYHPCREDWEALFTSAGATEWEKIFLSLRREEVERKCRNFLRTKSFSILSTTFSLKELYAS